MKSFKPFEYNPKLSDESRFTSGDCHIFAKKLREKFGYKVGFAGQEGYRHAICISENGNIVDINGINKRSDVIRKWGKIHDTEPSESVLNTWTPTTEVYEGSLNRAEELIEENKDKYEVF